MTAHWLSIEIALAADGLRTRKLSAASDKQTAERLRDLNKELPFILNFGTIGRKTFPRRLLGGFLTTIEYTSDVCLLILSKDSNIQKAVVMKNILPIEFRLPVGDPPHLVDGLLWPNSWCLTWPDPISWITSSPDLSVTLFPAGS